MTESSIQQADESRREEQLAEAIMDYMNEHPQAMDTLEGIAEWWIMRQRVRVDVEALARVLNHLTDQGVLERLGSGDTARYRLKIQHG